MNASRIAFRTSTAYSADRYTNWQAVAQALLDAGYTDRKAEAIMCSKWARWAADASGQEYGKVQPSVLVAYAKKQGGFAVDKLTAEHFAALR